MLRHLGLDKAKRDVLHKSPSANLEDVKKSRQKPTNQESLPPPRKSSRKRKPVLYNLDEDESEDGPRKRPAKRKALDEESYDPKTDECVTSQSPTPSKKRRTSSRKKAAINYNEDAAEEQIPATDSYIWCSQCNAQQYNGCELHPPLFANLEDFNLKVEKSAVAKNAGEGVFNRGETLKEGTVFGPYAGKVYTKVAYKKKIEAGDAVGFVHIVEDRLPLPRRLPWRRKRFLIGDILKLPTRARRFLGVIHVGGRPRLEDVPLRLGEAFVESQLSQLSFTL